METPQIIGIVNVTPDSFSDGGAYLEPGAAVTHARGLMQDGAAAVDVGAAASHPDAVEVSPAEELRRLEPVVRQLRKDGVPLSIDSYQPAVQRWAIEHEVAYLNDIHGFPHAEMHPDLAAAGCDLIVMHCVQRAGHATRAETEPEAVLEGVFAFFDERVAALTNAGVARKRLILDPGMGFFLGANPDATVLMLRNLGRLRKTFGCRVLVSVSRKSFLGAIAGQPVAQRGAATLAAELHAAQTGVDFIRTHDVRALADGLAVSAALRKEAPTPARA